MEAKPEAKASDGKFGTFGGVLVPNVLTILGVIMFMRTGWVVGQAGLQSALIILCNFLVDLAYGWLDPRSRE